MHAEARKERQMMSVTEELLGKRKWLIQERFQKVQGVSKSSKKYTLVGDSNILGIFPPCLNQKRIQLNFGFLNGIARSILAEVQVLIFSTILGILQPRLQNVAPNAQNQVPL